MAEKPYSNMARDKWSMSDERAFTENLLCSRFNFFLVFFALVIAAAVTTSDVWHFKIILTVGAAISIPFALTIARVQAKLDIALDCYIFKTEGHPAKIIDDKCPGRSKRKWIGYWIPLMCCATLSVAAALALLGYLAPGSGGQG